MEGCSYLLIGVEPGKLHNIEPVDTADLTKWLRPYVGGAAGPQWDPDYLDVDGATVLIITVSAPRPGDPAFPLRKEFSGTISCDRYNMPEGTVYVRHPGETRQANAADVDMLNGRARGSARRLDLAVVPATKPPPALRAVDDSPHGRTLWLNAERRRLLSALETDGASSESGVKRLSTKGKPFGGFFDHRSDQEYEAEVTEYLRVAEEQWVPNLQARAVAMALAPLRLAIENPTEENFAAVEVILRIEGEVAAFWTAEMAERHAAFPDAPPLLGKGGYMALREAQAMMNPRPRSSGAIDNARPLLVHHLPQDLRPLGRVLLPVVWLGIGAQHAGRLLTIRWSATSSAVTGLLAGVVDIPVQDAVVNSLTLVTLGDGSDGFSIS